jgi:hypothetical protein
MTFQEYWATRSSLDYDAMVEAEAAFKFQQSRMSMWRDVEDSLPEPEIQVLAIRLDTKEQASIDKEYHPVIFAAIDPDRAGVWYDWDGDKDIDTRYFEITHWMPVSDLV